MYTGLTTEIKKPTYLFEFEKEESATEFFALANSHPGTTNIQHPLNPDGRGCRIPTRVLVTGSESFNMNTILKKFLEEKAEFFDGCLV